MPAAQYWCDFILWEGILNENPETQAIMEFGTWKGGFSLYLAAQARTRGIEFFTYDSVAHADREIPGFTRLDIWKSPDALGLHLQAHEPVALLCDNGNKPRELRTFPPYLKDPRSFVVVHDWGTEVLPSDVPDNLLPIYESYCDDLGSVSRVFRVRTDALP